MTVDTRNTWRGKPITRFHAMAKPTGPVCNLNCSYCYYLSKEDLLEHEGTWRMSDEVLEAFIRQYIEGQNHERIIFSWQGGEPTLLGLDFFRRVIELQKKYCPPHKRCENDLQTNCTLLDDEWCAFLAENNFLVGLSIDGPRELHDRYRRDKQDRGTFDRVMRAAGLLHKHKVDFATLSCVNRETGQHPLEVYRFLRDEVGSTRMQFIPIVEPKVFRRTPPSMWSDESRPFVGSPQARPGGEGSVVEDWCVDPDDFGEFLCRIFDEWLAKDFGKVFVHYFESAVATWMGGVAPNCTQAPFCGKALAVEHDGSVYACDHYVYPIHRLGNVLEEPLHEMAYSPAQEAFGTDKERLLPQRCRNCTYLFACFGECPRNRFLRTPEGEPGLNYLCPGWRKFFRHIDRPVKRIAKAILAQGPVTA